MSFREEDNKYKELVQSFKETVKQAYTPRGIIFSEIDNLMIKSFRLAKYIRNYLNNSNVLIDTFVHVPGLPSALDGVRDLLNPKNGIVSLYFEADKYEALSRASYKWLKDNAMLVDSVI